jgi:hypothetical protein
MRKQASLGEFGRGHGHAFDYVIQLLMLSSEEVEQLENSSTGECLKM